ncbi:MAG: MMPL family transporter [bacterium]|nr:MMPL family transporter [bacterium]
MDRLYRYSIAHPLRVLLLASLVTAAAAPGALRLQLRTDGHALVPDGAPEIRFDQSIRDLFNTPDLIVVVIHSGHLDGVFNAQTLRLVQELSDRLAYIEGLRGIDLFSLATEKSDRVRPGSLKFRPFIDPLPETPEAFERLRGDLAAIDLYNGTLVSLDGRAASILIGIPPGMDRTDLYRRVHEVVAAVDPKQDRIDVIGAPVAEALLGTHILEDLGVPQAVLETPVGSSRSTQDVGLPRSLHELRVWIAGHVGLVPVAIAVMAVVFAISFRSPTAALLPLMEVGACLTFVFGLMGWCGVPVYLTIAVLPVILTAIGVADEIHIFTRYTQLLRVEPDADRLAALHRAVAEMAPPVVKTSVTTAIGFCSFTLSPLGPVQAFGVFMAVGILFCMCWSLTAVPALLALIPSRWLVRRRVAPADVAATAAGATWLTRLGGWTIRHRGVVIVVALAVAVAAPWGVARIAVQDSWIDGFAPESDFYQAIQSFNERFLGMHLLLVSVDTGHFELAGDLSSDDLGHHHVNLPGTLLDEPDSLIGCRLRLGRDLDDSAGDKVPATQPVRRRSIEWTTRIEGVERDGEAVKITYPRRRGSPQLAMARGPEGPVQFEITPRRLEDPEVLHLLEEFERFLADRTGDAVGGVIGTARAVATANHMSSGRRPGTRRIPDNVRGVATAWNRYQMNRGVPRLRQVVDADYGRSLITIFLKNANFVDTGRLMRAVRQYEQEHLAPHGITLGFAGDVAVSQRLIRDIVSTQVRSLLLSLVGIVAVTSLLGRSIRWGLLCVLPCALAVLVNFAMMGWTGMPLGVATSMFAGMTLGIGVDYAIHLLERYRAGRAQGLGRRPALIDAVGITGPAIVVDAVAVALGFGIMTLSQVPANARLGGLVVLSIVGCLAATLVVLPALLGGRDSRSEAQVGI